MADLFVAPLTGSVDRNRSGWASSAGSARSLPSRGAWIEIRPWKRDRKTYCVAPLTGSVDRNTPPRIASAKAAMSLPSRGAWIEIIYGQGGANTRYASLPSRGAWIEILLPSLFSWLTCVAPLTGSVDRNTSAGLEATKYVWSLPSRGAWIEILAVSPSPALPGVAPLTGSVDRNL